PALAGGIVVYSCAAFGFRDLFTVAVPLVDAAIWRWTDDAVSTSVVQSRICHCLHVSILQLDSIDALDRFRQSLDASNKRLCNEPWTERTSRHWLLQRRSKALLLDDCCQRVVVFGYRSIDVVRSHSSALVSSS